MPEETPQEIPIFVENIELPIPRQEKKQLNKNPPVQINTNSTNVYDSDNNIHVPPQMFRKAFGSNPYNQLLARSNFPFARFNRVDEELGDNSNDINLDLPGNALKRKIFQQLKKIHENQQLKEQGEKPLNNLLHLFARNPFANKADENMYEDHSMMSSDSEENEMLEEFEFVTRAKNSNTFSDEENEEEEEDDEDGVWSSDVDKTYSIYA